MTHRRSDRTRVIVLGLTGSIAMGKSTAAAMFRRLGVPVYDADRAVHRLMERGGLAVPMIDAAFPGVIQDGAVDRRALGARVFGKAAALATLEGILHPLVARQRQAFLRRASSSASRWSFSMFRCCSRPAASASATRWRWCRRRLGCNTRDCGDARA